MSGDATIARENEAGQFIIPMEWGEASHTGLTLRDDLTIEQWVVIGRRLSDAKGSVRWWIGDWARHGKRYGDKYKLAIEATGLSYISVSDCVAVAKEFTFTRRRVNLSWSTHRECMGLDSDEQKVTLDWAEATGATRREVRAHNHAVSRAVKRDHMAHAAMLAGTFSVIYCDPPWRYEHVKTETRSIENQYPTMDLDDIKSLKLPADDDCVLFLWATSPKIEEAIQVISAWGFLYRTCAVWVKDKIGMGYYFRQRHELLLVATKGAPPTPDPSDRFDSVINAPRGVHSEKPVVVYELIEAMYPDLRRCELFARTSRDGWAVWGNEIG